KYTHGDNFDAAYMGSVQSLPNGNVFVGWGEEPYFSEYSRSGRLLLDATFPSPDLTYRARLQQWSGVPAHPPAAAAQRVAGKTTVYASWNGATGVAAWRVLAGPSTDRLKSVALAPKSGFETAIPVTGDQRLFEVQALDADGKAVGTSHPVAAS